MIYPPKILPWLNDRFLCFNGHEFKHTSGFFQTPNRVAILVAASTILPL